MSSTTTATIYPDRWTQVASGSANVTVQGAPHCAFALHVGATAPAALPDAGAACVRAFGPDPVYQASGLAVGDKVFVASTTGLAAAVTVQAS